MLYTFLLRHAILDLTQTREDEQGKKRVEYLYVAVSVAVYVVSYYLETR